ncbi:MAG: ribosome assembly factor SBDS [Candidatus Nanohalarchaeota archaeon]|nr:MAG: ribosome assembly factor SBDS [Candidatus Nanohaloarchaeota archaeon]
MAKTIIASLKKNKKTFELILDFDNYLKWKDNREIPLSDLIVGDYCFSSISKAERANESDINEAFGTAEIEKIAEEILRKGQIQLTAAEMKELRAKKRKQIIEFICREAIDPQTNCPPTPARVEIALNEVHLDIDIFGSLDEQINDAIKKITPILPLIFQKDKVELQIPVSDAPAVQKIVRSSARILKERWTSDFWIVLVEMHTSKTTPFLEHLTQMCKKEIISKKKED